MNEIPMVHQSIDHSSLAMKLSLQKILGLSDRIETRTMATEILFFFSFFFRYLAGRFPETTHAVDIDGRTPLHYAATLADNGHYYNLLLHLGANPLVQDNVSIFNEFIKQPSVLHF